VVVLYDNRLLATHPFNKKTSIASTSMSLCLLQKKVLELIDKIALIKCKTKFFYKMSMMVRSVSRDIF
jgi:hypothetical protein